VAIALGPQIDGVKADLEIAVIMVVPLQGIALLLIVAGAVVAAADMVEVEADMVEVEADMVEEAVAEKRFLSWSGTLVTVHGVGFASNSLDIVAWTQICPCLRLRKN
jgi:predicted membrane protein